MAPIPVGCLLATRSAVSNVTVKSGRTGEMAFVTVRHELSADGVPAAVEEQDIVYRSEPPGTPPRTMERPEAGPPAPGAEWRAELATDPVLLFRFSALTYNGHRIHYDREYATQAEGYPDLVIHGPLLALLALDLPRLHAPAKAVTSFEYRLHPIGPMISGGFIAHPVEAAGELMRFVRDFAEDIPDELMLITGVVHAPDGSGLPLAVVAACHCGTLEQAEQDLAPLRSWGSPLMAEVGPMPYEAINSMLDDAYPRGALNYWKSTFLTELSDGAIAWYVTRIPRGAS